MTRTYLLPITAYEIKTHLPLSSVGLSVMHNRIVEIRDSYYDKSSSHWKAWENMRFAIEETIAQAKAHEAREKTSR